jgi:hypothetical protein
MDDEQTAANRRGVFLTRKTNLINHGDMARDLGIQPDYAGMVKKIEGGQDHPFYYGQSDCGDRGTPSHFNTETVSAYSFSKWYKTLIKSKTKDGKPLTYWVFQLVLYDIKYKLVPFSVSEGNKLEWAPTNIDEMVALMEDEDHQENGTIYP